jgi:hypothetical protein
VIRDEGGRSVINCDRCPVRLDLGPAGKVRPRLSMPSGWVQNEPERHLCPLCSSKELSGMVVAEPPPTL